MVLFGNKIEKVLNKCKKKQLPLEVRYLDGNQAHPSAIARVDRDKFLMHGFAETLREDMLEVSIKELGLSFETKVTHKTHDIRGQLLYYCTFPESFKPFGKRKERFFVYPRAVAALTESSLEEILVDDDVKLIKMYVLDITRDGLDLVNTKGRRFEKGKRFASCKITVGKVEAMVSMEVVGVSTKRYGKEMLPIIACRFTSTIENMDELMSICRRIDSL